MRYFYKNINKYIDLQVIIYFILVIHYIWSMDIKFEFRNTQEFDYQEMVEWWKWHRFKPVPRHVLPDNFCDGIMLSYKGENLCSGFIYRTSSSSLFWIEWIVSTPKIKDKELRAKGLRKLIEGLTYMGKQMGAKVIYTSLINSKLKEAFLDSGFVMGSSKADEMIYNL